MKIYIASDHAGFELKRALIEHLRSKGFEVEDCGAHELDPDDDYPDYIFPLATKVARGKPEDKGIVIGGSGQGEAMVANKVKGVRSALYYGGPSTSSGSDIIRLSKEHNDANVLSLGARFLTVDDAKEAVDLWLSTKFSGEERHVRRLGKIKKIEEKIYV